MKLFFAILLLVFGVCIACASKTSSSQTAQNNLAALVPSPTPTPTSSPEITAVQDAPPCSMMMDQAPIISGHRLGMTTEQALALFPGSNEDTEVRANLSRPPNQFGVSEFVIRPQKYEVKEKFAGVSHITFRLLNGQVSSISIGYNGPEYSHVDEFVTKFVAGTNLPGAGAWQAYVGLDTQMKTLTCKDFEVRIFAGGPGGSLNYVLLRDLVAAKKLKELEDKAAEKATP